MRRSLPAAIVGAALALAACGGSATPSPAASPLGQPSEAATQGAGGSGAASTACEPSTGAGAVAVTIADFAFSPDPVQASVGDVVEWTNEDSAPHTATLDDIECSTDSLANGASGALVFAEPGTYAYHCRIHPTMTGTIEVAG